MKTIRHTFIGAGLLLLATLAEGQAATAAADQTKIAATAVALNIKSQPIADALNQWAQATGYQLIFPEDAATSALLSAEINGTYAPRAALMELLKGTGLTYRFLNDRAVAIQHPQPFSSRGEGNFSLLRGQETAPGEGEGSATGEGGTAKWRMRLAQAENEEARAKPDHSEFSTESSENKETTAVAGEVVVTGTHIRGTAPVGMQVITIDREEIDRSGFSRADEIVRALPQNFGGGPSEDTLNQFTTGREASSNFALNTAPNLRGVGAGSTLVLIDGRRLAPGGLSGLFADVANIPISALERIDVLPDSASALYGSDAIGGVINFVLRKDYEGAETLARLGSTTEGSSREFQIAQTFGTRWQNGRALISYEFYKREPVLALDRSFAADSDKSSKGGANFDALDTNPGTIVIGSETWAIPGGQDGRALDPDALIQGTRNLRNLAEDQWLLPEQRRHSFFGSLSQDVGDRVVLSVQALIATRRGHIESSNAGFALPIPPTHPFYVNPTGGTDVIEVLYNFTDDFGPAASSPEVDMYNTVLGTTVRLNHGWQVAADVGSAREKEFISAFTMNFGALVTALFSTDPNAAFNPFGDGSATNRAVLDSIRASSDTRVNSDLTSSSVVADGPIASLSGGNVRLAIGGQYRRYELKSTNLISYLSEPNDSFDYDRDVNAAFAELLIPLVGDANSRRGLKRLSVSLAGRYEEYNDFGHSAVPKFELLWAPLPTLTLRGTWSKSFKAPDLRSLDESGNTSLILSLPDPLAASNSSVLIWRGGNADLEPELAKIWSVGVDYSPPSIPTLKVSMNYFDINFRDRIQSPLGGVSVASILQNASLAPFVIRNPTSAQRSELCARSSFQGVPGDCLNAPVDVILDGRIANTAVTETSGIDVLASYELDSQVGRLSFGLNTSYLLEYAQATLHSLPISSILNTQNNPVDLRVRGSVSWSVGAIVAAAYANYKDSYQFVSTTLQRPIGSWTTVDLHFGYQTPSTTGFLAGSSLFLNVQNVFKRSPPFVNAAFGYDVDNADPLGRFVSLQWRKAW